MTVFSPAVYAIKSYWVRPALLQYNLSLTSLYLQTPYFQIRVTV